MKKINKIMLLTVLLSIGLFVTSPKTVKAEDLLEEEVLQEIELDIENMTQKEAEQFLKDTIGLPQNFSISELEGRISVIPTSSSIIITYSTTSQIGTASEIGVKQVYIQNRDPGGYTYASSLILPIKSYNTDDTYFSGGVSVKDPTVGKEYRVKLTYYMIVDGVEYKFISTTDPILFTGN